MINRIKLSKSPLLAVALFLLLACPLTKGYAQETMNYKAYRASQHTFQSSDGTLKYVDKGEGDVILLLHGVPTSSWLYRKMIAGLVADGHRVIAPDMLGYGSSDNPEGYELYSPAQHAKRTLELMDFLNIKQWTHVMHDAGGLWTWELMKKSPDRINKLILLNTIIYEEGFNPPMRMRQGMFAKFVMGLYKKKRTRKILLKQLFKKGLEKRKLTKGELEGYEVPLHEEKTNGIYYFFSKTCSKLPNYDDVINNTHIPVAIIWGKNDKMLTWEPQKEKVIKGLKVKPENLHLLEGNHFLQEEYSDTVNTIILQFMRDND